MIGGYCTVPGCESPVENRDLGLCATHNKEARAKYVPPKPKKPINKVSTTRKEQLKIYFLLRDKWIEGKKCAVHKNMPATDVHHMKGREGALLLDTRYWLPVSRLGHREITDNSAWAIRKGYSLKRNSQ